MASRVARLDQAQPRGGGGVVVQKNAQKERRNHRTALGDIGNLDAVRHVEGGKQPKNQINRPVTRSFGAQLVANAQAAAAASQKHKHKQAVDLGVVVVKRAGGKKGAQVVKIPNPQAAAVENIKKQQQGEEQGVDLGVGKEVVAKAEKGGECKCEEAAANNVIIISTETSNGRTVKERSRKKKTRGGPTFTSLLTARSKEAAIGGVDRKREDLVIVNIDEASGDDELAVAEYAEDIYKFYKLTEGESQVCDYMGKQPDIDERMRSILVDWLIEVHHKFELRQETLYLTVNIIDRFLSLKAVPRKELQLVGISSMLIASKYEEIWSPQVNDFVCISDRAYISEQVLAMEKVILGKLEWQLTFPTPYMFLTRYAKASLPSTSEMENLVYFFAELGLMNYSTIISYCPSILAASSVYAARCTLESSPPWTETLKHYTGYSQEQLKDCAKLLVSFHSTAPDSKLKAVYKKFSKPDLGAVALKTPAKSLLS